METVAIRTHSEIRIPSVETFQEGDVYRIQSIMNGYITLEKLEIDIIQDPEESLIYNGVIINLAKRIIIRPNGVHANLSKTEWKLLKTLLLYKDRMASQKELLSRTWGGEYSNDLQYLRVWISRIRAKVPELPIITIAGQGYRMVLDPDDPDLEVAISIEHRIK